MTKKTNTINYIDNKKLTEELAKYAKACSIAQETNQPKPIANRYLANCLYLIAENLGTASNFSQYPFLTQMQSDGIENCIAYMHNFNPEKTNGFAYLSMIMYNAFVLRIKKEKKILYVKYKMMLDDPNFCIKSDAATVEKVTIFVNDFETKMKEELKIAKQKRRDKNKELAQDE